MEGSFEKSRSGLGGTFVAFDTETTGLWAPSNRIVEIAGVRFLRDGTVLETMAQLINPGMAIPEQVTAIHGITDDMVSGAERAGAVLKRFFEFCEPDSILIAHNALFDISFVWHECQRNSLSLSENVILDSCSLARKLIPGQKSYSLLSLSKSLELAVEQEHRALSDALLVARLSAHLFGLCSEDVTLSEVAQLSGSYSLPSYADRPAVPDNFADMQGAIDNENALLQIVYEKDDETVQTRRVRPLLIHAYNGRLYLNAFCYEVKAERTFRLERIRSYTVLSD
jgi:DNA polymerase III epsilon subunit family exonuclease